MQARKSLPWNNMATNSAVKCRSGLVHERFDFKCQATLHESIRRTSFVADSTEPIRNHVRPNILCVWCTNCCAEGSSKDMMKKANLSLRPIVAPSMSQEKEHALLASCCFRCVPREEPPRASDTMWNAERQVSRDLAPKLE